MTAIALKNLDKVLWPDAGFTKGDMLAYYRAVAPALLPHVAGRPMTLARFPDGVYGPGWYQLDCAAAPPWLPIAQVVARDGRRLRYALINSVEALLWCANWGAIELHPYLHDAAAPAHPHSIVFDLDPGPPAGLLACCALALRLRDLLAAGGRSCRVNTSGRAGLHVYADDDDPQVTYATTKAFARATATLLAQRHPGLLVTTMARDARAGRVYVDWGQNDPGKSTIAPYSLRACREPRVAMPVTWDEVEAALRSQDPRALVFGPRQALERLARLTDTTRNA
jgi:bifunctional non-homologous end joining protein LigD